MLARAQQRSLARRASPCIVVVRLERVEQAGDRFANALTIARRSIARHLVVKAGGLERLFANDRQRAVFRIFRIVEKHPHGAAKRGDFHLQVDEPARYFFVIHQAACQPRVADRYLIRFFASTLIDAIRPAEVQA